MNRLFSYLFLSIIAVFGAFVGTMAISLQQLDVNAHKKELSNTLSYVIGREVVILGDLDLEISVSPSFVANNILIGNTEWGTQKDFIKIKQIVAHTSIIPLLRGEVEIVSLELQKPIFNLEISKTGDKNWKLIQMDKDKIDSFLSLNVDNVKINGAILNILNHQSQKQITISADSISVNKNLFGEIINLPRSNNGIIAVDHPVVKYKNTRGGFETTVAADNAEVFISDISRISNLSQIDIESFSIHTSSISYMNSSKGKSLDIIIQEIHGDRNTAGSYKYKVNGNGILLNGKFDKKIIDMEFPSAIAHLDNMASKINAEVNGSYNNVPLHATGTIPSISDFLKNTKSKISATINTNNITIDLKGIIEQPTKFSNYLLSTRLHTDDINNINRLTAQNFPNIGAVTISGDLHDEKNNIFLTSIKSTILASDFLGKAKLTINDKNQLEIIAESDKVYLSKQMLTALKNHDYGKPARNNTSKFNIKTYINIGELTLDQYTAKNARLSFISDDDDTSIKVVDTTFSGGKVNADIRLTSTDQGETKISTRLIVDQLRPEQLPSFEKSGIVSDGYTDIYFSAEGQGDDSKSILASLTGDLLVKVDQANINNSKVKFPGSSLLLSGKEGVTHLQCGVIMFNIDKGIAHTDKKMAFETDKINMLGSGSINLNTGELDLNMHPQSAGLTVGQLTDYIQLGGTIAEPEPRVDATETLKTMAKVGAAIATSGFSLIANVLYDHITTDKSPCATILKS